MENLSDPVFFKLVLFLVHDHAAAATKDFDVIGPRGMQKVLHVFEVFHVSALIRAHTDALSALLQDRTHHVRDRTIVPQMNDLGPTLLQKPANHIDRRIMPVKERSSGHNSNSILRTLQHYDILLDKESLEKKERQLAMSSALVSAAGSMTVVEDELSTTLASRKTKARNHLRVLPLLGQATIGGRAAHAPPRGEASSRANTE